MAVFEKKLNLTQEKHALTNQKKCTTQKTKASYSRLLRQPAWKRSGSTLKGKDKQGKSEVKRMWESFDKRAKMHTYTVPKSKKTNQQRIAPIKGTQPTRGNEMWTVATHVACLLSYLLQLLAIPRTHNAVLSLWIVV